MSSTSPLILCGAAVLSLSACAVLPNRLSAYAEHISHTCQHFGSEPTNYGYNTLNISARWQSRKGPFLEISEGYNLTPCWHGGSVSGCGALEGPREVFSARAGWTWRIHK